MASLRTLVGATQFALDAVANSFSPSPTATSRTIRVNGAVCILVGMLCVLACGGLLMLWRASPMLLLFPSLLAYAFFTVGGYRLIRGQEPKAQHAGEVSGTRIALGCMAVLFCFSLLLAMIWVASMLFEH